MKNINTNQNDNAKNYSVIAEKFESVFIEHSEKKIDGNNGYNKRGSVANK